MKNLSQRLIVFYFFSIFAVVSISGQTVTSNPVSANSASTYTLLIENEDGKQTNLTLAEIGKLKRQTVKGNDHGTEAVFEGFLLADVLKLAGIEFGESLRGKRLATFLLAEAADSYQAIYALPEIDSGFTDKIIIIADRRDGKPLSEKEGVLRIIVPGEKRQGRWVRQLRSLKLLRAPASNK